MRDWINRLFGIPRGIAKEIQQLILDAVNGIVNWADGVFGWIMQWINNEVDYVANGFGYLISLVGSAVLNSLQTAWGWVQNAASYVINLIAGVENRLGGFIQSLKDYALKSIDYLVNWTQNVGPWIQSTFIDPVMGFVNHLIDEVENQWPAWFAGKVGDIGSRIDGVVNQIYSDIAKGFSSVFNPIADVIDIVRRSWDWLVWFATHGFTAMHDLVFGGWNFSARQFLGGILQAWQEHGDDAEQVVARWIFGLFLAPLVLFGKYRPRRSWRHVWRKGN